MYRTAATICLVAILSAWASAPRCAEPGIEVREILLDPQDGTRDGRVVPLKIYLADGPTSPSPVVLFSHGLGGSREGASYLGRHWAGAGYVAVFMQHPGSDSSVWRDVPANQRLQAMERAASGRSFFDRMGDVRFTLDMLQRWQNQKGHPLAGRMDLRRIGMSGHSFGAVTTQAAMGQRFALGRMIGEPRLRAFIAMSPSPGRSGRSPSDSFGHIDKPVLCMTGTRDRSMISKEVTPEMRMSVYAALPPGDKYQVVFKDGQHTIFSDRPIIGERRDPRIHPAIQRLTTAFWDAYLRDDAEAKAFLQSQAAREVLAEGDVWESK